jgi:Fe(3+) dicitrate transport protein
MRTKKLCRDVKVTEQSSMHTQMWGTVVSPRLFVLSLCLGLGFFVPEVANAAPGSQPKQATSQPNTKSDKKKAPPKQTQPKTDTTRKKPPTRRKADDQPMMLGDISLYGGTKRTKPPKNKAANKPKLAPGKRHRAPGKRKKPKVPITNLLPQVDVIGRRPANLDSTPGSADIIDQKTLERTSPLSASEALREVPGVHISDEDGVGLRLNIGFRGLDPVRSRKILVLEDGIPVAMAPYGEPEMYYTPHIARMKRIEVVKGSGSILWGPQTIGGVLNLITKEPPKRLLVRAAARYGSYNYFLAQASVGNTVGNVGYLFEAIHQRYDGFNKLNLVATDISSKFRIALTPTSVLGIKLHYYDEFSNATYLGLTTPQYLNDPTQNHATNDEFPIRRYGISLSHKHFFGSAGLLQTTLYGHYVTRFWKRQDFARYTSAGVNYERIINGSNKIVSSAPGNGSSIFFLNSTGNRNRAFTVAGLDFRYSVEFDAGPVSNEIMAGLRLHTERGDEQYLIGENATSPSGVIRDQEDRTTAALAAYLQYRFSFLKRRLHITPGFRFELINGVRYLSRTRALVPGSSTRVIKDVNIREETWMIAPIPGLGISFQAMPGFNLFAGVHRGFAPPRTKDSITADGEDLELEPEYSWNAELGLRIRRDNYLHIQAAGFFLYFENQVIPPSESTGAVATDPSNQGKSVINGGQTLHAGLELSATFDIPAWLKSGFRLPLTVNYTWIPLAQFADGVYAGNRLPYAPEHTLTTRLQFIHNSGFNLSVTGHFLSAQTTDKGASITPTIDGLIGEIPARFLLDARIGYTFKRDRWSIGAFVAGKNLTNVTYISSRRPQGIKVGTPLTIMGGLHGSL